MEFSMIKISITKFLFQVALLMSKWVVNLRRMLLLMQERENSLVLKQAPLSSSVFQVLHKEYSLLGFSYHKKILIAASSNWLFIRVIMWTMQSGWICRCHQLAQSLLIIKLPLSQDRTNQCHSICGSITRSGAVEMISVSEWIMTYWKRLIRME